jgi:hypothetical protein
MNKPPYTTTDLGLAISGVLTASATLADLMGWLPIDKATETTSIPALAIVLATSIVSFSAHRAVKHAVANLPATTPPPAKVA